MVRRGGMAAGMGIVRLGGLVYGGCSQENIDPVGKISSYGENHNFILLPRSRTKTTISWEN